MLPSRPPCRHGPGSAPHPGARSPMRHPRQRPSTPSPPAPEPVRDVPRRSSRLACRQARPGPPGSSPGLRRGWRPGCRSPLVRGSVPGTSWRTRAVLSRDRSGPGHRSRPPRAGEGLRPALRACRAVAGPVRATPRPVVYADPPPLRPGPPDPWPDRPGGPPVDRRPRGCPAAVRSPRPGGWEGRGRAPARGRPRARPRPATGRTGA